MKHESFIYLWYDAPNKMYYLGKHKGTPDDSYTHSSTIWEHFTKDNIPKGVRRRILAYGTDEKMCILEHKLLVNRKNRHWDRYYNESLGDPRYVDVDVSGENNPFFGKKHSEESRKKMSEKKSGENHPMYKHGNAVGCKSPDKEVRSRARKREYEHSKDNYNAKRREWYTKNRDKRVVQMREYYANNRDDINAKRREHLAKNRDKILAQHREYYANNRDDINAKRRVKYQRKKAERQGVGTLEQFMG